MEKKRKYPERIRHSTQNLALKISGFLIPLLQYLPAMGYWLGFMSMPLIGFLIYLFQYPFMYDRAIEIVFISDYYGKSVFVFGMVFFIFSFIFQMYHRKSLINKGPYKLFKHPQYLAICLTTLGLTILCYHYYSSVIPLFGSFYIDRIWIVITWIVEVLLYILLAKAENYSLQARYGAYYLDYEKNINDRWKLKHANETEVRLVSLAFVLLLTFGADYLFIQGAFSYYDVFFSFFFSFLIVVYLSNFKLTQ